MRLLHIRTIDERQGAARQESASDGRRSARCVNRKHLPMLELQSVRRRGVGGRGQIACFGGKAMTPLKSVGHPTPRIDAVQRVTGTANYTGDIRLPGMLYARVLRSPHA